jgi:hypothetical protein
MQMSTSRQLSVNCKFIIVHIIQINTIYIQLLTVSANCWCL